MPYGNPKGRFSHGATPAVESKPEALRYCPFAQAAIFAFPYATNKPLSCVAEADIKTAWSEMFSVISMLACPSSLACSQC